MSAPATRAELDAERADRAGCRELRYTRSGVLVGLYDNVPAGLDPEPGRWSTVCEVHAHIITHRTLADAEGWLSRPEEWCEGCMEEIER